MRRRFGAVVVLVIFFSVLLAGNEIRLIEPAEAIRLIGKKSVVFVSGDDNASYSDAHISGSVHMDAELLHHLDIKEAQAYIRSKGIRNDQMVIVYGRHLGPKAVSVYNFFENLGHKELRLLNEGLAGIKALDPNQKLYDRLTAEKRDIKSQLEKIVTSDDGTAQEKMESKINATKAKMETIRPILLVEKGTEPAHKESNYSLDEKKITDSYIADRKELKSAIDDILQKGRESQFAIIDLRCPGDDSNSSDMAESIKGIPAAISMDSVFFIDSNESERLKPLSELKRYVDETGINKEQTIFVYCRGKKEELSATVSALRLLGYENIKLYIDKTP